MNSEKILHIISFDNPYPPNYGGVIDVFFKVKALHAQGVKVILHCFVYGRKVHEELNAWCSQVYYYQRSRWVNPFSGLPYIVATRSNPLLLQRLIANPHPILFEGLHTCYYLNHPKLKDRLKAVRMHNIEHDYYNNLKEVTPSLFKKLFFKRESKRLRNYEQMLHHANIIYAISKNDALYLGAHFRNVELIPAFHANTSITAKTGTGAYAFYHGKLSVGENDEAARFLVEKVFSRTDYPLRIAGNDPSEALRKAVSRLPHVTLDETLDTEGISEMIQNAHVNVMPTFQATGIKLKLINVLYKGRFVIANNNMVVNTGCESLCMIANTAEAFIEAIDDLRNREFTENDLATRELILDSLFNNELHAQQLIRSLWD